MNHAIIRSIGVQMISLEKQRAALDQELFKLKAALIGELRFANPGTEEGRNLERICLVIMSSNPCAMIAEQLAHFGDNGPQTTDHGPAPKGGAA